MTDVRDLIEAVRDAGAVLRAEPPDLVVSPAGVLSESLRRELKERKPEVIAALTHPDLLELSEEFRRMDRIRIDTVCGYAWLVASYDDADDIREGAVYSVDVWPYFVALSPEEKLEVHEFLCGLGGGRFDGCSIE